MGLFAPKNENAIFSIKCNFLFFQKDLFYKNSTTKGLRPSRGFKSTLKGTAKASANTLTKKMPLQGALTGAPTLSDAQGLKIAIF
jgi:hypothetical protein